MDINNLLKGNRNLIVLVLFAFIIRFMLMSASLDLFDSFDFAEALDDFDLAKDQPHSPYYIVYIGLAKLTYLFIQDHRLALILPNVVLGALAIPFVYLLGKRHSETVGLAAAALFAINPLAWLSSEIVLSDMVSAFFVIGYAYFILNHKKGYNFQLAALFFALAIGARITNGAFGILALYILWGDNDFLKRLGMFVALSVILCGTWFLPVAIDGGAGAWYGGIFGNDATGSAFIRESALASDPLYSLPMRFGIFGYTSSYMEGMNPARINLKSLFTEVVPFENIGYSSVAMHASPYIPGIFGLLAAAFLLFKAYSGRKKGDLLPFYLVWIIPFFLWLALFQDPYGVRYQLPLVAPFCILLAYGLVVWLKENRKQAISVFAILAVVWFSTGLYLAYTIHTEPAPPIQMGEYVAKNYGEGYVLLLYGDYRHIEYYYPALSYIPVHYKGEGFEGLPNGRYLIDKRAAAYLEIETMNCMSFAREPMIHFQHSAVTLCEPEVQNG